MLLSVDFVVDLWWVDRGKSSEDACVAFEGT